MASYCCADADEGRGLPLVPKRTMGSVTSGTRPREDSRLMEKMTRARPAPGLCLLGEGDTPA